MKLFIDTTDSDRIKVGLDNDIQTADSRKEKSQMVLPFIIELLEKNDMSLADISEIEVKTGPGSFTGIRVGVAVAQTLGWILKIPVNGKKIDANDYLELQYD